VIYFYFWFSVTSVHIATGYKLDGRGIRVRFLARARDFSLLQSLNSKSDAHPASCTMDTSNISLGLKWPGRENGHSLLYNAEVKNSGGIPPFLYVFVAWCSTETALPLSYTRVFYQDSLY
jgi:hypothetical protein